LVAAVLATAMLHDLVPITSSVSSSRRLVPVISVLLGLLHTIMITKKNVPSKHHGDVFNSIVNILQLQLGEFFVIY